MNIRKFTALLLAAVLCIALLAGCGTKTEPQASASPEATSTVSEGTVLNFWIWNDELRSRVNQFYPGVESIAEDLSTTTLKNGVTIKWTVNPNQDNNYQNKLDEALLAQDSAAQDDKIDMFAIEADYALKYVDSDYTVDVKADIGLTDADLADQYEYTKLIATDSNGALKGVSWQATPGLFIYRRDIAKAVLGTDDPATVQTYLSDWDTFNATAAKMGTAGYKMLSGLNDSYRTFSNNVSAPWVTGTTLTVDQNLMNWVSQTKEYTDKGYNNKVQELWSPEWCADQAPGSKVFGFFYSTWGINFTLMGYTLDTAVADGGVLEKGNGLYGEWAVCEGPQSYYWGGTWMCAAAGNDNAATIKDIMYYMTCDKATMKSITEDPSVQDYTNTVSGMEELANSDFKSDFLGGQNHIALFSEAAQKIDMSNISAYDQGCNEKFQKAFQDYFNGTIDLETAKANFETAIKETYPELTEVVWPA